MKATFAIVLALQAAVASAGCFDNTNCIPYDAVNDAGSSALELRQRGTACLDAAEALRARSGSRHACFRPLDSAGIALFNNANLVEYSSWSTQQTVTDNAWEVEQQRYQAEQEAYQRDVERYNREKAEYDRQCAAYRAATGLNCQ